MASHPGGSVQWEVDLVRSCPSGESSWWRVVLYSGNSPIPGGPEITEQSIQTIFQDFALINSYLCSPYWIEHFFPIILIPRSSNLIENFLFYELISYGLSSSGFARFPLSFEVR